MVLCSMYNGKFPNTRKISYINIQLQPRHSKNCNKNENFSINEYLHMSKLQLANII